MRPAAALAFRRAWLALSMLAMAACDPGEVLSVTSTKGDVTLVEGETRHLPLRDETTGDARRTVSWSISDPSVATLLRSKASYLAGVVALSEGATQITATSTVDRTKADTITVTVLPACSDTSATAPLGR